MVMIMDKINEPTQSHIKLSQALDSSHDTICDSVNDTINAIAAGGRHWINVTNENLFSLEKEKNAFLFVPATCN